VRAVRNGPRTSKVTPRPSVPRWEEKYSREPSGLKAGPQISLASWPTGRRTGRHTPSGRDDDDLEVAAVLGDEDVAGLRDDEVVDARSGASSPSVFAS
jgi:hypothetical protein